MQTINERILLIINHFCGGTRALFAEKVNEKPQTINGWLKRNIGRSITNKIIRNFPEVNESWLLTGEGQMLNQEPQPQSSFSDNEPSGNDDETGLIARIKSQLRAQFAREKAELIADSARKTADNAKKDADIAARDAEIERLKQEVAMLKAVVSSRDDEFSA